MIGIIGGMGPHAGKNLFKCILDQTIAKKDQDHLPVILWSTPNHISDRTEFLIGKTEINPAVEVSNIAKKMHGLGVKVIGIPCNTFHAKPIWQVFQTNLSALDKKSIQIINMVDCTTKVIKRNHPRITVGILGTLGTYQNNVYGNALSHLGISSVIPEKDWQIKLHESVYHPTFGIKAAGKVTNESLEIIHTVIEQIKEQGANLVLLGCTEFSLIPFDKLPPYVLFIDPVSELAAAMISAYRNIDGA